MSILEAYEKGGFRNEVSVLATLVKLSFSDGVLDESEMKVIERVARNYGFNDPFDLQEIIKNYENYTIEPAYNYDERIEQLYRLMQVIYADDHLDKAELKIVKNSIVALGFPAKNTDIIFETAVGQIADEADLEDFTKAIKKVNKL
jgi:uncharacterized tellurite resistance protein B-like protein